MLVRRANNLSYIILHVITAMVAICLINSSTVRVTHINEFWPFFFSNQNWLQHATIQHHALSLLPWRAVVIVGAQVRLNEFHGHFTGLAQRLWKWYLCNKSGCLGKRGTWAWYKLYGKRVGYCPGFSWVIVNSTPVFGYCWMMGSALGSAPQWGRVAVFMALWEGVRQSQGRWPWFGRGQFCTTWHHTEGHNSVGS